jgi:hypothetical protein
MKENTPQSIVLFIAKNWKLMWFILVESTFTIRQSKNPRQKQRNPENKRPSLKSRIKEASSSKGCCLSDDKGYPFPERNLYRYFCIFW